MKKLFFLLLAITGFSILLTSCSKDELPSMKNYYSKIRVKVVNLPGTSDMDVYFGEKKLGLIAPNGDFTSFVVSAETEGKLVFKKAGTDSVRADTLIRIAKDGSREFTLAYSEEFGINGFVNGNQTTAPDSAAIQLLNGISAANYPVEKIDIEVIYYDNADFSVQQTGFVIKGLKRKQLSPVVIKLPVNDSQGQLLYYGLRLFNSATGEQIIDVNGTDVVFLDIAAGLSYIVQVHDNSSAVLLTDRVAF